LGQTVNFAKIEKKAKLKCYHFRVILSDSNKDIQHSED